MANSPDSTLTCRTCKWWGTEDLGAADWVAGYRWCKLSGDIDADRPAARNGVVAEDGGPSTRIGTGPDFGCLRHEAK